MAEQNPGSRPPKRKRLGRAEKKAATRAALLEAAARVFGRGGFYGASVEEIAEEAGFSRGAVYSNFESKEDLFPPDFLGHLLILFFGGLAALGNDPNPGAVE